MLATIVSNLVPVLGTLLTAVVTWAVAQLALWISAHVKNTKAAAALVRLEQAVGKAVLSVQQSYVDALKGTSGSWTAATATIAKDKAIADALNILGTAGRSEIETALGFAPGTLSAAIAPLVEAAIATLVKKV